MKAWIARDKDGGLYLYSDKPQKDDIFYYKTIHSDSMVLDKKLFPNVTFENSPQEVEIKLVKK